jgi:hypothetical protein
MVLMVVSVVPVVVVVDFWIQQCHVALDGP